MADSPFLLDAGVPLAGDNPQRSPLLTAGRRFFLGRAGGLVQIAAPALGYIKTPTQSETAHTLLSGGMAVTRGPATKYQWAFNWSMISGRDWEILNGFYRRVFGPGPWCLIAPDETNRLTDVASMCGAMNGVVEGWAVSAGTLVCDPTVAPAIQPGGVMRWHGAGSGSLLVLGSLPAGVPTPDVMSAPPYVQQLPFTVSVYARTATGTASVTLDGSGRNADGSLVAAVASPAVALSSTAWTRVSVTLAPGDLPVSPYLLPVLHCATASAPDILLSAPQVEHASQANDWALGSGSPRVVMPGSPSRTIDGQLKSTVTVVLAES